MFAALAAYKQARGDSNVPKRWIDNPKLGPWCVNQRISYKNDKLSADRVKRLNDLGFAVDEIELEPGGEGRIRMRVCVTNRRFHAGELERLARLRALEGQARLLLNDLHEYGVWLERSERSRTSFLRSSRALGGSARQWGLR